eukprot:NODE_7024_length_1616_cov_5.486904.p5 GENE.NODE_7024_length_1616_cov_5.486904~~NODE_7024_length_1616_cov_5.486904.p5  ORF type:complete len:67 (-),score=17.94 NODE_7024_length_1616_cov_5.486904:954-1154(-)
MASPRGLEAMMSSLQSPRCLGAAGQSTLGAPARLRRNYPKKDRARELQRTVHNAQEQALDTSSPRR